MTSATDAALLTLAMGAVILFCRAFPFLFFRGRNSGGPFLAFVEKVVPPAAMTVLAFNALAAPLKDRPALTTLAAAAFTALIHLWKRNPLLSIFGGTAAYMLLEKLL
jgi:branched-subunit amino acid transport protein AzlD